MKMSDWHRCSRWEDSVNTLCPFTGAKGHEEEDDRQQDERQRPRDSLGLPDSPLFFAFDKLNKTVKEESIVKPKREVSPPPTLLPTPEPKPVEVPPVAAIQPEVTPRYTPENPWDGEQWLRNFKAQLARIAIAPSPAPATNSSTVPNTVPAPSLAGSAVRASDSERALTRSFYPWRSTARPWDIGASATPATVMGASTAPEASSPRSRPSRQRPDRSRRNYLPWAAAAMVGAGAVYLHGRGFGGGGGGDAPAVIRGSGSGSRGAQWAVP